ncbi:retention module-containing protein [Rhodoferax bucti]|uniref:retention module-containing protein n=1 Tax=Rhodoferax bucti TaxID=2576305 RepID=UPI001107B6F4|nr:retention module-containing protein [Rhodoferax bucti]
MATSQISAQARGVVVILQGNAWVVSSDGNKRAIKLGDEIQEGQVVLTEDGTRLELALPNGKEISLESGRELLIDANLLGFAPEDATNAALKDLNSGAAAIARVIATGGDLSTELEATAAGLSGGDASDSHSFVRVMRISEGVSPLAIDRENTTPTSETNTISGSTPVIANGISATGGITDNDQPSITGVEVGNPGATDDNVVEGAALVYNVTLSATTTIASTYTFAVGSGTATAGTATTGDYNATPVFSNGVTYNSTTGQITVPAGVSSFSVTYSTNDDTVVDSASRETLPLTIGGVSATGGITDNDQPSITGVEVGNPGATDDNVVEGAALVYNVTLSATTTIASTYTFAVGSGTATAGTATTGDYNATPVFSNGVTYNSTTGQITVPAGVSSFSVTYSTNDDTVVDSASRETLPLTIGGVSATGGITDNDHIKNDTATTAEDSPVTINVLANDSFENAVRTITAVNGSAITDGGASVAVTNGSVALVGGQLVFTPATNFNGTVPVFTYTVTSGGVTEIANVTVTVTPVNDAPVVTNVTTAVSEEGLAGGIADTTGNVAGADTTNAVSVSGSIATDPDSALTVTLTAPGGTLTSGGVNVTWSGTGTEANPLIGSAGGVEVLRASVNSIGTYNITLSKPIDHVTGNGENVRTLTFGVNASDGVAPAATGTITLNIEDDSPTAVASTKTVTLPSINTNIELILDVSGSMGDAVGTSTRLQIMKDSVALMLDQYDNLGDVKVRIVAFSSTATANSAGWVSVADAKAYVNSLTANGGTNYDAAISTAQTAWTTPGKMTNAQNVSYFLTDGAPNTGFEIQTADETIWTDFLNRNEINSYAYGMGTGATAANMDPIAYNGIGAGTNTTSTVVADVTQLPPILRDSILVPTGGDIVTGGLGAGSGMGADGGQLASVTVNGTTYAYNSAAGGSITTTGTNRGVFDTTENTMTITTTAGGKLVIDMDSGLYTYTPPVSTSATFNESIGFSLIDKDGDSASNTLTITVNPPGTAPATGIDTGLNLTLTTSTTAVTTSGLHGEFFGYNETNGISGNNYQAGDATVGNADRVADLNTIINLRQGSTIVGSGTSASAAASDATWNATNINYGVSPTVTGNLGTNPNIVAADTAITSGALYNFLGAANTSNNASSLKTTSSFGTTTDSMLRFAGSAYFAAGNYDFRVRADDGFSIRIDGVTVFEFNDIQSPTTRTSSSIAIGEGLHTIEILYWEQGGNAELQVGYKLSSSATYLNLSLDNLAMFQSTELPTLTDLQDIVESSTNGQYVIRTGQEVTGSGSNDTITGSAGRDRIHGGDGNDVINAGTGADWMEGGRGNDTLTGGAGSDTFRWQLSDRGITGQPAVDTITDFDSAAAKSGGDVLDLRDLLPDQLGTNSLVNYLDFNVTGGNTVLRISSTGGFTGGTYSAAATDQQIVFQGVTNLGDSLGLGTAATDAQIIQELINRGKLIMD